MTGSGVALWGLVGPLELQCTPCGVLKSGIGEREKKLYRLVIRAFVMCCAGGLANRRLHRRNPKSTPNLRGARRNAACGFREVGRGARKELGATES